MKIQTLHSRLMITLTAVMPALLVTFIAPGPVAADNHNELDKITIRLDFTPNLEDGRKTFGVCARCHLPEAWGNEDGTYPQLAGQHVNVLMKQLLDIRSGNRHSSLMFPFVQERTIGGYQEMSNVVAYISTLPMNPDHNKGPWRSRDKRYIEDEALYQKHCTGCHGENGEGNNARAQPRLQGQHFAYVNQQLTKVKSGLRKVDPAMQAVIEQLDYDQLEKVANYASYFEVPPEDLAESRAWRNPDFQ